MLETEDREAGNGTGKVIRLTVQSRLREPESVSPNGQGAGTATTGSSDTVADEAAGLPSRLAFGVELPAGRNDMVVAVAALTQLISIADEQGVDADDSVRQAILQMRHTLEGASVVLPEPLLALIDSLVPADPDPDGRGRPVLRLVDR